LLYILKKIFTSVYMALFIYLPIIAQITAILSITILEDARRTPILGLIYLLVIFVITTAFGYLWGRKKSEEKFGVSYYVILAIPLYTLLYANVAFALSEGYLSDSYFTPVTFFSNPTFCVINFLYILIGQYLYMFLTPLVSYIAFGAGFTLALKRKGAKIQKRSFFVLFGITVLLALAFSAQYVQKSYSMLSSSVLKLESLTENENRYEYYHDTPITNLRGESTLKLQDNFPILDGASALFPLYLSAFKAIYPETEDMYNALKDSNTPLAYKNLIDGKVELIFVATPSDEQRRDVKGKGVELVLTPIGKEAFVFLTNVANPVKSLSVENIRDIYTGKITNWRELGGENEKILAFQRNKNSGSQSAMENYVMKGLEFKEPLKEEFYGNMGGMIEGVANYRNAIGYSFRYYATVMKTSDSIRLLAVEGVEPTAENIQNSTYAFGGKAYIVSTQNISENGKKIIEWFLSPQGQALVEDVGYVPLRR